tara:strand:- start:970 stop:2679 length:1710 start_codon:yes stop_codon:yes gene_type:complete
MCGLTVSFGKNISFNLHKSMSRDLTHRGPDYKKDLIINDKTFFSHNRLKIIDLSNSANQPMYRNNCHLVFNGMIYNYLEVKKELENFYTFKTNSDTEVILVAYLKWGKNCFKKFDGMFSIVIWDANIKKLIIARDRLGIKPLYYRIYNQNLYISSEAKPLLKVANYQINKETVKKYFTYSSYEEKDSTFFKEINQFLPGYVYEVGYQLKFIKKKYWCLFSIIKKEQNNKKIKDVNLAKELVLNELERILKTYSRSDKKISLLYSSGLDSGALLKLLNSERKVVSLLLTFGFKSEKIIDEISLMKKRSSISHHKERFGLKNFISSMSRVTREQEMPWGGPNTFFQGELLNYSKKKQHNVSISADGADEIFGGYGKYLNNNKKKNFSLNYINRAIDNSLPYEKSILSENFYTNKINLDIKCPSNNYLDNARYIDIAISKLPRNFRFSDRFSMNQSIELRYPFLDHKLIELSFKFSQNLFLNKNKNKIILRKIYNDNRVKKHINSPQTNWLYNKNFKKYIDEVLKKTPTYEFGLDKKKVRSYVDMFYSKKLNNSFKLWQIINYDLWIKNFFV